MHVYCYIIIPLLTIDNCNAFIISSLFNRKIIWLLMTDKAPRPWENKQLLQASDLQMLSVLFWPFDGDDLPRVDLAVGRMK